MHWLTLLVAGNQFTNLNSFSDTWCNLSNLRQNRMHPLILFITFSAIGSQNILSSNTHPWYITCECCFIFIWLYLMFSWRIFFDLHLLEKRIDLVLSSPKCILNLLSTNQRIDLVLSSSECILNLLSTNQRIDLVLSSPKCILNLLSTNQRINLVLSSPKCKLNCYPQTKESI